MTYVPGAGIVMFGGTSYETTPRNLADTWSWDGTAWHDISTMGETPPRRRGHATSYDPLRAELVMFGGTGDVRHDDTWTWRVGVGWHPKEPSTKPQAREDIGMTWDPARRTLVMFGGRYGSAAFDELWLWDGAMWKRELTAHLAPAMGRPAFVYDEGHHQAIALGPDGAWRLQWRSSGLDEVCTTDDDRDGDALAGCADPDCDAICN